MESHGREVEMNILACCCGCSHPSLNISPAGVAFWLISTIIIFGIMGYGMSKAADEEARI